MSNYNANGKRNRSRVLIIVEGDHEKDVFFERLIKCYNININPNNILIYKTNIYKLYMDIEKEYGEDWNNDDIDLPYIVSKKKCVETLFKYDFTNILIIFDYERHDPDFEESKIIKLQEYFTDATDVGQLYLNYPMVESYLDFESIPDNNFINKKIRANISLGTEYKVLINQKYMSKLINFPDVLNKTLAKVYNIEDNNIRIECIQQILSIGYKENILNRLEDILSKAIEDSANLVTAKQHINSTISSLKYAENSANYYDYLKQCFDYLIKQNIIKGIYIQVGEANTYANKELFENIDFKQILIKQNELSRNSELGYIWILNTSIMFIAEYNYNFLL